MEKMLDQIEPPVRQMETAVQKEVGSIHARIIARDFTIGVIGLGYVGLPLVQSSLAKNFKVVGFDIDPHKIDLLSRGKSYIRHIGDDTISAMNSSGRFSATSDMARICDVDAVLMCIPTPLNRNREPDMSFVVSTVEAIAPYVRRGQIIVLESTTYPGTMKEVVRQIVEKKSGLQSEKDIYFAYSPEREDPGNERYSMAKIPKVVGAEGPQALALTCALYNQIVAGTIPVSSSATAEAVKITENVFRSVNIALVNELKVIYDAMGIDVWEVIEAAKTKPFGFMPFYPGPGIGGHCIPADPFYLAWKAREFDIITHFIELAGEINGAMPRIVIDSVARALDKASGKGLTRAKVLILGVAYKKNVDDMRDSPSLKLIELAEDRGATVEFYDSYIPVIPKSRDHAKLSGRTSWNWSADKLSDFDVVLIATDHDNVDYTELVANSRLVVDTRNATRNVTIGREKIVKA